MNGIDNVIRAVPILLQPYRSSEAERYLAIWQGIVDMMNDPEPAMRNFVYLVIKSVLPGIGTLLSSARQHNSKLATSFIRTALRLVASDSILENRVEAIAIVGSFALHIGTQNPNERHFIEQAFMAIIKRLVDVHVTYKNHPDEQIELERIELMLALFTFVNVDGLPPMARHTLHMLLYLVTDAMSSLPANAYTMRVSLINAINECVPQRASLQLIIGNLYTAEVRRLLSVIPPSNGPLRQPLLLFIARWPAHSQHEAHSVAFIYEGIKQLGNFTPAYFRDSKSFQQTTRALEAEVKFRRKFNLMMRARALLLVPGTFAQLTAVQEPPPSPISSRASSRVSLGRRTSVTSIGGDERGLGDEPLGATGAPFFAGNNTFPHTSGLWLFLPNGTPHTLFTLRKPHEALPGVPEGFITTAAVQSTINFPASSPVAPDIPRNYSFFVGRPAPVIPPGSTLDTPPVPAMTNARSLMQRDRSQGARKTHRRRSVIGKHDPTSHRIGLLTHPTFHYERDKEPRVKPLIVHAGLPSTARTTGNEHIKHAPSIPEGYLKTPLTPGQAAAITGLPRLHQYEEDMLDFPVHQPLILEQHEPVDADSGQTGGAGVPLDDGTDGQSVASMTSTVMTFASSMSVSTNSTAIYMQGDVSSSTRIPVASRYLLRVTRVEELDPMARHDAETIALCSGVEARSTRADDASATGTTGSRARLMAGQPKGEEVEILPSQTFKMVIRHRFTRRWYRLMVEVERTDIADEAGPMIEASGRWMALHKAKAHEPPCPVPAGVDTSGNKLYLPLYNTVPIPAGYVRGAGGDYTPYYTLPAPPRPAPTGMLMDGTLYWSMDRQATPDTSGQVLGGVTAAGMPFFYPSSSSVPVPAGFTPGGIPFYSLTGLLDFMRGRRGQGNGDVQMADFIEPLAVALVRTVDGTATVPDTGPSSASSIAMPTLDVIHPQHTIEEEDEGVGDHLSDSEMTDDATITQITRRTLRPVSSMLMRRGGSVQVSRGGAGAGLGAGLTPGSRITSSRVSARSPAHMVDMDSESTTSGSGADVGDTIDWTSDASDEGLVRHLPTTEDTGQGVKAALAHAYMDIPPPREFPAHGTLDINAPDGLAFAATHSVQERELTITWTLPDESLLPHVGDDSESSSDVDELSDPLELYVISENRVFSAEPSQLTLFTSEGTVDIAVRFNPVLSLTKSVDVQSVLLIHDAAGHHLGQISLSGFVGPTIGHSHPKLTEVWALPGMTRATDVTVFNLSGMDASAGLTIEDALMSANVDGDASFPAPDDHITVSTAQVDIGPHEETTVSVIFSPDVRGVYRAKLIITGPGDERHSIDIEALAADPLLTKARRDRPLGESQLFENMSHRASMASPQTNFMGVTGMDMAPQTEEDLLDDRVLGRRSSVVSLLDSEEAISEEEYVDMTYTETESTVESGSEIESTESEYDSEESTYSPSRGASASTTGPSRVASRKERRSAKARGVPSLRQKMASLQQPSGKPGPALSPLAQGSTSVSDVGEVPDSARFSSADEAEMAGERPRIGVEGADSGELTRPSTGRAMVEALQDSGRGSGTESIIESEPGSRVSTPQTKETEEAEEEEGEQKHGKKKELKPIEAGLLEPKAAPRRIKRPTIVPAVKLDSSLLDDRTNWGAGGITKSSPRPEPAPIREPRPGAGDMPETIEEETQPTQPPLPRRRKSKRVHPKSRHRGALSEWERAALPSADLMADTSRVDLDFGLVPIGRAKSRGLELKNLANAVLHSIVRVQHPLFRAPDTIAVPPRATVSLPVTMTGQGDWNHAAPDLELPPNIPIGETTHEMRIFSTQSGTRLVQLTGFVGQGVFFSSSSTVCFSPASIGQTTQITLPLVNMTRHTVTLTISPLGKSGSLAAQTFATDISSSIRTPTKLRPYCVTPVQFTYTPMTIVPLTAEVVLQVHKPFRLTLPGTYAGTMTLLGTTLDPGPHNILDALKGAFVGRAPFTTIQRNLPRSVMKAARAPTVSDCIIMDPEHATVGAGPTSVMLTNTTEEPVSVTTLITPPFIVENREPFMTTELQPGEAIELPVSIDSNPRCIFGGGRHSEGIHSGWIAATVLDTKGHITSVAAASLMAVSPLIPPLLVTPTSRVIVLPDAGLGHTTSVTGSVRVPLFDGLSVEFNIDQQSDSPAFNLEGVDPATPIRLAPFAIRVFKISFTPAMHGDFAGVLRIRAVRDGTVIHAIEIGLRGSAAVPVPAGLPDKIDFGNVIIRSSYTLPVTADPGLDSTTMTILSSERAFQPKDDQLTIEPDRPTTFQISYKATDPGEKSGLIQLCTAVDAQLVPVTGRAGTLDVTAMTCPSVQQGRVDLGLCRVGMSYVVDLVLVNSGTLDVNISHIRSTDDGSLKLLFAGSPIRHVTCKTASTRRGWALLRRNLRIAAANMQSVQGGVNPIYNQDTSADDLFTRDIAVDDMSGLSHFVGQSSFVKVEREREDDVLPLALADRRQIGHLPPLQAGALHHYKILFIPRTQGTLDFKLNFFHDVATPLMNTPLETYGKKCRWPAATDIPVDAQRTFSLAVNADVSDRLYFSPMIVGFGVVAASDAFGPRESVVAAKVHSRTEDATEAFFASDEAHGRPAELPVAFRAITVFNPAITPQRLEFASVPHQFAIPKCYSINPSVTIPAKKSLRIPLAFQPTHTQKTVSERITLTYPMGSSQITLEGTGGAARLQLMTSPAVDFGTVHLGLSFIEGVRLTNTGLLGTTAHVSVAVFLPQRRARHKPSTRHATPSAPHPLAALVLESYTIAAVGETATPVHADSTSATVELGPGMALNLAVVARTVTVSRQIFSSYCPPNSLVSTVAGQVTVAWADAAGGQTKSLVIPVRMKVGVSALTASTSAISFGQVMRGVRVAKAFELTNKGSCDADATLTTDQGDLTIEPSEVTVPAGQVVKVQAVLVPSGSSSLNGVIKIVAPPSTKIELACTAEVTVPQLIVATEDFPTDMGVVMVGSDAAAPLSIRNIGNSSVQYQIDVDCWDVDMSDYDDHQRAFGHADGHELPTFKPTNPFTFTPPEGTISALDTTTVMIRAAPALPRVRYTCSLTVSAPGSLERYAVNIQVVGGHVDLLVKCTGGDVAVGLGMGVQSISQRQAEYDFGALELRPPLSQFDVTSVTHIVRNIGNVATSVQINTGPVYRTLGQGHELATPTPLSVAPSSANLPPDASVSIRVRCAPCAIGRLSGVIKVTSSRRVGDVTLPVSATIGAPGVTAPDQLDFGPIHPRADTSTTFTLRAAGTIETRSCVVTSDQADWLDIMRHSTTRIAIVGGSVGLVPWPANPPTPTDLTPPAPMGVGVDLPGGTTNIPDGDALPCPMWPVDAAVQVADPRCSTLPPNRAATHDVTVTFHPPQNPTFETLTDALVIVVGGPSVSPRLLSSLCPRGTPRRVTMGSDVIQALQEALVHAHFIRVPVSAQPVPVSIAIGHDGPPSTLDDVISTDVAIGPALRGTIHHQTLQIVNRSPIPLTINALLTYPDNLMARLKRPALTPRGLTSTRLTVQGKDATVKDLPMLLLPDQDDDAEREGVLSTPGLAVAPNEAVGLTVAFTGRASREYVTSLTLFDAATGSPLHQATLRALAGEVCLTADLPLNFGQVSLGSKVSRKIHLRNTGTLPLAVELATDPAWMTAGDDAPLQLTTWFDSDSGLIEPGQALAVHATFAAGTTRELSGALTVMVTNVQAAAIKVPINARAKPSPFTLTPPGPVDLGTIPPHSSAVTDLHLQCSVYQPLQWEIVLLSDLADVTAPPPPQPSGFTVTPASGTISAGQPVDVKVTFTSHDPPSTTSSAEAYLAVTDASGVQEPFIKQLTAAVDTPSIICTGSFTRDIDAHTRSLDFGAVPVGHAVAREFHLTNPGTTLPCFLAVATTSTDFTATVQLDGGVLSHVSANAHANVCRVEPGGGATLSIRFEAVESSEATGGVRLFWSSHPTLAAALREGATRGADPVHAHDGHLHIPLHATAAAFSLDRTRLKAESFGRIRPGGDAVIRSVDIVNSSLLPAVVTVSVEGPRSPEYSPDDLVQVSDRTITLDAEATHTIDVMASIPWPGAGEGRGAVDGFLAWLRPFIGNLPVIEKFTVALRVPGATYHVPLDIRIQLPELALTRDELDFGMTLPNVPVTLPVTISTDAPHPLAFSVRPGHPSITTSVASGVVKPGSPVTTSFTFVSPVVFMLPSKFAPPATAQVVFAVCDDSLPATIIPASVHVVSDLSVAEDEPAGLVCSAPHINFGEVPCKVTNTLSLVVAAPSAPSAVRLALSVDSARFKVPAVINIPLGAFTEIPIRYTPTAPESTRAILTLRQTSPQSRQALEVKLVGAGMLLDIHIARTNVVVGKVPVGAEAFVSTLVRNTGNMHAHLRAVQHPKSDLIKLRATKDVSLAPGEAADIVIGATFTRPEPASGTVTFVPIIGDEVADVDAASSVAFPVHVEGEGDCITLRDEVATLIAASGPRTFDETEEEIVDPALELLSTAPTEADPVRMKDLTALPEPITTMDDRRMASILARPPPMLNIQLPRGRALAPLRFRRTHRVPVHVPLGKTRKEDLV